MFGIKTLLLDIKDLINKNYLNKGKYFPVLGVPFGKKIHLNKFKLRRINTPYVSLWYKIFFETPKIGFYYFKLERIKYHKHTKTDTILYILKGEGTAKIGNKIIKAKNGDLVIIPKDVPHDWKMKKPLEYLEILSPSLTSTNIADDTVWLKKN